MPKYFKENYPNVVDPVANEVTTNYSNYYFALNAFIVSCMGLISATVGGILSDKYEKKGYLMTKAYVCIAAGIGGIPTSCICLLLNNNFWVSITFLGLEYLVAESWFAPAIAMILNTISPENKGFAVSAFVYLSTMSGTLGTWVCGFLSDRFVDTVTTYDVISKKDTTVATNPEMYGKILTIMIIISYGGSIPFFWLAGREYTAHKNKEKEKEEQTTQGF